MSVRRRDADWANYPAQLERHSTRIVSHSSRPLSRSRKASETPWKPQHVALQQPSGHPGVSSADAQGLDRSLRWLRSLGMLSTGVVGVPGGRVPMVVPSCTLRLPLCLCSTNLSLAGEDVVMCNHGNGIANGLQRRSKRSANLVPFLVLSSN